MNKSFNEVKEIITNLSENDYENFVKALIHLETGIEDMEMLSQKYQFYLKNDDITLLSTEFLEEQTPTRKREKQFEMER